MNQEIPDIQAGFRKGRGTRDQIANICWIVKKAREYQKTIYFCFIDYAKAFSCVDHSKLWKILEEMGIPDHLTVASWPAYRFLKRQLRWSDIPISFRIVHAFELWCLRRLLRVPWTARRSNQSILKEISPGISLEGMMLKLKLQYFAPYPVLTVVSRPAYPFCRRQVWWSGVPISLRIFHSLWSTQSRAFKFNRIPLVYLAFIYIALEQRCYFAD